MEAYHLAPRQLSGGPAWLDSDWYVVDAKADGPTDASRLREMLQTLLAERFRLATHRESREMPVYAVTVGKKGAKLHALQAGDDPSTWRSREQVIALWGRRVAEAKAHWGGISGIQPFLNSLNDLNSLDGSGGPPISRLVLDRTGLKGTYWIQIGWDSDEDLIPAIEDELGLKFEARRAAVDVVVIDHVEKPSEN